jgi:hypothetical protein
VTALAAACNRNIPAPECLAWHIAGRIPDAKMNPNGQTLRCRCPNHDDGKPSLVISVGDGAPITWICHACGKDAALEVRAALISVYRIEPKCLPMSRQQRAELEEMVFAVFGTDYTPCTKLVCIRALHEGMRGSLPRAPALVGLGERAGVSRAQAFRAARELGGASLNHLFISRDESRNKNPGVSPAFRYSAPISNRDSISNCDSAQYQIETGGNEAA